MGLLSYGVIVFADGIFSFGTRPIMSSLLGLMWLRLVDF